MVCLDASHIFANTVIHSSAYEILMDSPFVRVAHSDWPEVLINGTAAVAAVGSATAAVAAGAAAAKFYTYRNSCSAR